MARSASRNTRETVWVTPAEDIRTVAVNQVSWGAVFAGAAIALVMQLILNMIGLGVGLSTMDSARRHAKRGIAINRCRHLVGRFWHYCGCARRLYRRSAVRQSLGINHRLSQLDFLGSCDACSDVFALVCCFRVDGRSGEHRVVRSEWSREGNRWIPTDGRSDGCPSLNSVSDPMAAIENKVRSAAGGQDPAALRDAAATAVRAALSGDAAKQAEANDKAAEALAKAQNISADEAKAQVAQYQRQWARRRSRPSKRQMRPQNASHKAHCSARLHYC